MTCRQFVIVPDYNCPYSVSKSCANYPYSVSFLDTNYLYFASKMRHNYPYSVRELVVFF